MCPLYKTHISSLCISIIYIYEYVVYMCAQKQTYSIHISIWIAVNSSECKLWIEHILWMCIYENASVLTFAYTISKYARAKYKKKTNINTDVPMVWYIQKSQIAHSAGTQYSLNSHPFIYLYWVYTTHIFRTLRYAHSL